MTTRIGSSRAAVSGREPSVGSRLEQSDRTVRFLSIRMKRHISITASHHPPLLVVTSIRWTLIASSIVYVYMHSSTSSRDCPARRSGMFTPLYFRTSVPAAATSRFCTTAGGTCLAPSRAWIDAVIPRGSGQGVQLPRDPPWECGMWNAVVSDRDWAMCDSISGAMLVLQGSADGIRVDRLDC